MRLAAAEALVSLTNKLTQSGTPWSSPPPLYPFYKRLFFVRLPNLVTAGVPVTSNIIQRNDFRDLVKYFIQKEVPVIMARLRNSKGECPTEIITLLLDMWKYNENRKNFYSDSYYRAALVRHFKNFSVSDFKILHMEAESFVLLHTFAQHYSCSWVYVIS